MRLALSLEFEYTRVFSAEPFCFLWPDVSDPRLLALDAVSFCLLIITLFILNALGGNIYSIALFALFLSLTWLAYWCIACWKFWWFLPHLILLRNAWLRASFALGSSWLYILFRLPDWSLSFLPLESDLAAVVVDCRTKCCCSLTSCFLLLCVSMLFLFKDENGVLSVGWNNPLPTVVETPYTACKLLLWVLLDILDPW